MSYNLTTKLMAPLVGLGLANTKTLESPYGKLLEEPSFKGCFLATQDNDMINDEVLLAMFEEKDNKSLLAGIRKSCLYVFEFFPDDIHIVYVLKIPDKYKGIKAQFVQGEYSKINKEFVQEHFSPYIISEVTHYGRGTYIPSTNWQIFHKSSELKEFWENKLNTTLNEDAEVWSIPNKDLETI